MAKLKDRRSSDNSLSVYRQKLEPSTSNSSYRNYTCKLQLDSRKGSDTGRRSSTCQCHKFVMDTASRDVPAQKSRLRSKESVFGLKDALNARPRVPRQDLAEEYYKMTKSMDSKSAFDRYFREDGSSLDLSRDRHISRICPRRDDGDDSDGDDRLSRRQGTGRRTRTLGTTLREKIKRTPETLAYLCVRVIVENVMWCEENHRLWIVERCEKEIAKHWKKKTELRISKLLLNWFIEDYILFGRNLIFFLIKLD